MRIPKSFDQEQLGRVIEAALERESSAGSGAP